MKSIIRKPKKNLGAILAVALGVTLLIGVQVGSIGIEKALANEWYATTGETDLAIYDTANPVFPANVSEYIINNAELSNLQGYTHRFDVPLTYYIGGALEKGVTTQGLVPSDMGPNGFGQFFDMSGKVVDAELLNQPNSIFVNDVLAEELGLSIGDVITSSMADLAGGSIPLQLEVVAIVDHLAGRAQLDAPGPGSNLAFTNIETFQSKLMPELQDYVTQIDFQFNGVKRSVDDLDIDEQTFPGKQTVEDNLDEIDATLKESEDLSDTLRVYSARLQIAEGIKDSIDSITAVLTLFVFMLNLVGLLLIINVQAMAMDDRRYQTAVLRAMGSNKSQIFAVFLSESAIIGVLGSLLGVGFGLIYGKFVEQTIVDIFGLSASSSGIAFESSLILTAVIFGVALAVLTAVIPAYFAASRTITNELRGIEEEKLEEKRSRKVFVLGLSIMVAGLMSAQNIGEFWKDEAWVSFEDTTKILVALGFSIFGLGLMLSYINRRVGYNLAGITMYGLALYSLFDRLELVETGNGNNWLLVIMLYLVTGVVMIVVVNFDWIMEALHRVLSISPSMRAISQVSTRGMMAKKGRLAMVFTVLTIVLVLNIFIAVSANSFLTANVDAYEVRSDGVDIVINSDVPNAEIETVVEELSEVNNVFAFRSFTSPIFRADPADYTADELTNFLTFRTIVEFNESEVNPDGDWGVNSFLPYTYSVNDISVEGVEYKNELGLSEQENNALSRQLLDQFWDNPQVEYEAQLWDGEYEESTGTENRNGSMIIGDYFSTWWEDAYFQVNGSTMNTYSVGAMFSMTGAFEMMSGAILVTPELYAQLPGSDLIKEPNVFLVKSDVDYNDEEASRALAIKIEQVLNNLEDGDSLSSQEGILLGATTRIVREEVYSLWADEASFWDFLNIFSALGLIIGAAGMIIIAIRSVQERTREIGMMRAIGFQRRTVVFTVAIELIFVSTVGLLAGILSGLFMTSAFLETVLGIPPQYPLGILSLYVFGVTGIAVLAGILPGIRASRIPASEALRYTG